MNKPAIRESIEVPQAVQANPTFQSTYPEIPTVHAHSSEPVKEPYTNYKAFNDANIIPGRLVCEGYAPRHAIDIACHTSIPITGENVKRHVDADHGAGFRIRVKRIKDRTSPFWPSLKEQGLEIQELRCEHCDAVIDVSATRMLLHFSPHKGKNRRSKATDELLITFVTPTPAEAEEFMDPFMANSN